MKVNSVLNNSSDNITNINDISSLGRQQSICAVICELNPLHNGHKYIFEKAREISGCDFVLALMGGNFCQRAEPTIVSEQIRAEAALNCGADIVIELPAIYSSSSADEFARGAILILNSISNVTHLVMGAETDDAEILKAIGDIQAEEPAEYINVLKANLSDGKSYARAITASSAEAMLMRGFNPETTSKLLNAPNNILAVSYRKMLTTYKSKIEFMPVLRQPEQMSATEIRASIFSNEAKCAMPKVSHQLTTDRINAHPVSLQIYDALTMHTLRSRTQEQIADCLDCAEGLEHKIKKAAMSAGNYDELLSLSSSKRYTNGRLRRICLHNLLGITRELQLSGYNYARLLGIRSYAESVLSTLPKNIIKNSDDEKNIPSEFAACYAVDKTACSVYSIITSASGIGFYNKLIKI